MRNSVGEHGFKGHTLSNMQKCFDELSDKECFGRTDFMRVLIITASPASELISKMLKAELIVAVTGRGKGKYIFKAF